MRGVIIAKEINERISPGVEAEPLGFYKEGDIVEVKFSVPGEEYDGEDLWYRLDNGNYLWSGGVSVRWDAKLLTPEDRQQFILSYRKNIGGENRPDMDTKEIPDTVYFSPIMLPAESESMRVSEFTPEDFAQTVVDSVVNLENKRDHVLIYIHGYQLFSSLKLGLLENFMMNYFTRKDNKIAKVIFLTWPSQGSPDRKSVDDRSIRAGQMFTANNLFRYFQVLSEELAKVGKSLDLLVHSFGNQLLNGMINPLPGDELKIPGRTIFRNIFLMAPDISHLALKKDGQKLRNYFKDEKGEDYQYDYTKLKSLALNVHVFFDQHDYLLYVSTTKFLGKDNLGDRATTESYRSMGNYGGKVILPETDLQDGFIFWDVGELIRKPVPADFLQFPFQSLRRSTVRSIDRVLENGNYEKIKGIKVLFNLSRFPNRHRYLFTCSQVVTKVTELLS